jgi:ribosomal protein L7/L12
MHPISLIFLGLCAFLVGFWLVRKLERRKVKSSGPSATLAPAYSAPTRPTPKADQQLDADADAAPASLAIEPPQTADANQGTAAGASRDIRDLILENRQSEAIDYLHEQQGWDLQHAKDYIDQQVQQQSSRDLDPEVIAEARQLLAANRKVTAVKLIYDHTGWSLKAAKDYVENSL